MTSFIVILNSTGFLSCVSLNGNGLGHSAMSRRKDISGAPKSVYHVSFVRNTGWPTGRESYGHRVLIVVVGVTSHQGDGNTVRRAKQGRLDNQQGT